MAEDDKTEKATPKKVKDARKRGQIARSRDLALAGATVAAAIALSRVGERLMGGLGERVARALGHLDEHALRAITGGELSGVIVDGGIALTLLVGPIAISTMAAGVVISGLQGGWNFAPEGLKFNFSRLSPAQGFKRLGFSQSGVDTLKTLVGVAAIGWLSWLTIEKLMAEAPRLAWLSPVDAALAGWTHAQELLWRVAWGLGFLALGDYGLQKFRLLSGLKMSKQEIRDESQQADGSAEVKARMRRVQQELSRSRMMQDVPRATVVITNPTHFAIALEYRRATMAAPVVLAKGRDHIAARIRAMALEHGVPLVENKPLAQALFKAAEIGETIPAPLFAAVAEVLAQLIRLKRLIL